MQTVDLNALLTERRSDLERLVPQNVSILVDAEPGLPNVRANAAETAEVVSQLVTDLGAMLGDEGGRVVLRTAWCDEEESVLLHVFQDGAPVEWAQDVTIDCVPTPSLMHAEGLVVSAGGTIDVADQQELGKTVTLAFPAHRTPVPVG